MIQNTDVENIIKTKREIRSFKPDPIPQGLINKILEAGRLCQSSRNSQPWHFITITNKSTLEAIANDTHTGRYIRDAPLAIAVLLDKNGYLADGGRVVQNMMLVAWKYGIGSVWVSNFSDKTLDLLQVPKNKFNLLTVIPFGFLPDGNKPRGKKVRKNLEEIVSSEKYFP